MQLSRSLLLFLSLLALGACDRPPSADSLPVWTPDDHHTVDDSKLAAASKAAPAPAPGENGSGDVAQLVDITWAQQCTNCHGALGRGDGPLSPMVQAPDLSRAAWQSGVTDAEILSTIQNGKNKMPRFDLPQPVLRGLVARVRSLRSP